MVFVSKNLPSDYLEGLRSHGLDLILLPSDPRLSPPISSHPDMLLFVDQGVLITDYWYYETLAKEEINIACHHHKLQLILTDEPPQKEYPNDIRYNALVLGDLLFCHPTHTSPTVLQLARRKGVTCVPTKQGYARCSACPISTDAIITADPSIADAAKKNDLEVCFIHQGHILLPGYSYGFIGGCCGSQENKLFFCGDPALHPDGEIMLSFVRKHGLIPIILPGLPLLDAGSLLFIS